MKSKQAKTEKKADGSIKRAARPVDVKSHHFMLGVKTFGTRKSAEMAVLSAFSRRQPDGCEFYLRDIRKDEWMAGAQAGMQAAIEMVSRSIENLRKTCGVQIGINKKGNK